MSMVLLILAGVAVMCGLLSLILGLVALVRINRSNGALRGRGLAIGAIVIGALLLLSIPQVLILLVVG